MSKPFSGKLIITVALFFAASAIPAFANHGGGGGGGFHGGGGGFHGGGGFGGGGFHGGGGFRGGSAVRGGGSFRGGPPAASYGARSYAPSARSGQGYASRPGNSYSRPSGSYANGGQRSANSSMARPGIADGQWHSFGGSTEARGPSGAAGASNSGGLHVLNGNRGASNGAVRSFSGQRGDIFEEAPSGRNVVPRGQSLSTMHNSFSASLGGNSGFRSGGAFSAPSRFGAGSAFLGNRGFTSGVNTIPLRGGFNHFGFNNGFFGGGFGFNRFGRGCWNCGFGRFGGFGFGGFGLGFGWGGWGWGWPWLGFGWSDPFWFDPWWGWPAPAYGYYGYSPYGYAYPDSEYGPPPDYNSYPPAQDSGEYDEDQGNTDQGNAIQGSMNGNWVTPNGPSPAVAPNNGAMAVPVLIYLKNGSLLTVRDYWMIDGELHYISMGGVQRAVNLEAVDLPRTNTENAKSGVKFIFKSEPSVTSPEPDGNGAPAQPNMQPGGSNAPAPTQQINAVPQPEART